MDENLWTSAEHAHAYLAEADSIPHRTEGEATLLELLPLPLSRVLDLGSGDGRLVSLIQAARPEASVVAVDFLRRCSRDCARASAGTGAWK